MPTQTIATGDVAAMADVVNPASDSIITVPAYCSDMMNMSRFLERPQLCRRSSACRSRYPDIRPRNEGDWLGDHPVSKTKPNLSLLRTKLGTKKMTLEDFERSLAKEYKAADGGRSAEGNEIGGQTHRHHNHHHKRKHHRAGEEREPGHKRSRRSGHESRSLNDVTSESQNHSRLDHKDVEGSEEQPTEALQADKRPIQSSNHAREGEVLKRDSWMEAPSALEIEFIQKRNSKPPQPPPSRSSKADFDLKIHEKELNQHHLKDLAEGRNIPEEVREDSMQHIVDYTFGDAGSQWRMMKLKNVLRQAEETGRSVDDVANDVYGSLRSFDDAKEEQTELERRDTYGPGYVGMEKPSGKLFREREIPFDVRRSDSREFSEGFAQEPGSPSVNDKQSASSTTNPLDHTALNRLKAQMIKARLRGSPDASRLEAEYETALRSAAAPAEPASIVLGAMENRMLAGGRKGEVKSVDNKRGRERGLVEENEDMSIEDMVREERRIRHQDGGESQRFAERIAKDVKFDVPYLTHHYRTWLMLS
jgi:hypothetical protein